jgi:hypothetical protein
MKQNKKIKRTLSLGAYLFKFKNRTIKEAVGIDGEDGDEEKIVHTADSLAKIYCNIIHWEIKFDSIIIIIEGLNF